MIAPSVRHVLVGFAAVAAVAAVATVTACGVFGPDVTRSFTIELPFCGAFPTPLAWAAVKKADAGWKYLAPTNGAVSFDASGAITVAYGNPLESRVYSATAEELSQVSCFPQWSEEKLLEGSVRDVPAADRFFVSVGPVSVTESPFAVFIPHGPVDVVARTEAISTGEPQRVIVRHDVDLPTAAEIPILDFSSSEARLFESAPAIVNGFGAGVFFSTFWSWGNSHNLASGEFDLAAFQYYAVPEALLGPRDYHTLNIREFSDNVPRELTFYYRRARAITLDMGPAPPTPIGTLLAAEPCARLQVRIASQPAYPSFVVAQFFVNPGQNNQTMVEVGVSKDFLGQTPSTWTLDTPDLRSPGGECLVRPFPTSWSASVVPQEGRIALHLGARGRDGEVRRWSITSWSPP